MKHVFLILAVLILAVSAQAQTPTQVRTGKWEATLQTRYVASQDLTNDRGASLSLEDDLGWGFGFGYNFSDKFNLGFGLSWRALGYNATAISQDDPQENISYNGTMNTSTVMITGRWTPLPGRITPYVSGGVGWVAVDSNIYAGTEGVCYWDPWWGYVCGTYSQTYGTDSASYEMGLGLDFSLSPELFVRVGYDHNWLDLESYDGADMFRLDFGGIF